MRAVWFSWLLPACVIGAPPGFSPGESWTFPLVDPLAHEPLITPVTIGGKGPFLFVIDPDASTSVDAAILQQVSVGDVQIGDLHVDGLPYVASKQHAFDTADRRIAGVLGKEVITSALVLGFDRDRGIAWLATPKHAVIPAGARSIDYIEGATRDRTAPRDRGPYVSGTIDGLEQDLHVDVGRTANTLRTDRWGGLAVQDHVATAKHVTAGHGANAIERFGVTFAPFVDSAYLSDERSATIGLDFFWDFTVAVSFDAHRIYVAPRTNVAPSARIARWNLSCKHVGCAELVLHGKDLEVIPERTPIQLVVRAVAHDGTALPSLEVDLDAGARRFAVPLDDKYADAALDVIDASPFPRTCTGANGCVVPYAR